MSTWTPGKPARYHVEHWGVGYPDFEHPKWWLWKSYIQLPSATKRVLALREHGTTVRLWDTVDQKEIDV